MTEVAWHNQALKYIMRVGLLLMIFANGYLWKDLFIRAVAEHTDNIDGLTAAYFQICSGFGALTFIAWGYILIKVDRYTEKRRGSEDDGKEEGGDME